MCQSLSTIRKMERSTRSGSNGCRERNGSYSTNDAFVNDDADMKIKNDVMHSYDTTGDDSSVEIYFQSHGISSPTDSGSGPTRHLFINHQGAGNEIVFERDVADIDEASCEVIKTNGKLNVVGARYLQFWQCHPMTITRFFLISTTAISTASLRFGQKLSTT